MKKRFYVLLIIILIMITAFFADLFVSCKALTTTNYTTSSSKISEEMRIVLLSDLHESRFGKDNVRLIKKVKKCEPDVIITVGDMVSSYTEDFSYLEKLLKDLSKIAPVYCSLGNHELDNPNLDKLKEIMKENTLGFLDNEYTNININGNSVRLGGLMNYHPDNEETNVFVDDYCNTGDFTLLMCHCPEYYIWGIDERKVDVMLCGHTHGGQVIIPFKGGLFAPEQEWFPYFDYGVFEEENATLVISRGLGTSKQIAPRFNNPPEIVSLTITPEV